MYAFVPAHDESRACAVQQHLGRTWSEGCGLAVLLVDFDSQAIAASDARPPRLAREGGLHRCTISTTDARAFRNLIAAVGGAYEVICVDLTGAPDPISRAVLTAAHSVFLVSDSARPALERARAALERFRQLQLDDCVALLLRRVAGGLRTDLAEDFVGVPVCGLVDSMEQIARLARWLAQPRAALAEIA